MDSIESKEQLERGQAFLREKGRQNRSFSYPKKRKKSLFSIHPLFWIVGIWYALTGELFLFFDVFHRFRVSGIVHENVNAPAVFLAVGGDETR